LVHKYYHDMTEAAPIVADEIDAKLIAALKLCLVSGVGPRTRQQLLAHFGSAENVLAASISQLREVGGVGPKLAKSIVEARSSTDAEKELQRCRATNVEVLVEGSDGYPRMLAEIPDPPGALFIRGRIEASDRLAIAIVGTRHATPYGIAQAERLASGLSRAGYTIISGLARGIDSAAHQAALAAGGRTIAVLGSGVLNVYPPENDRLATEITKAGAVISESPPLAPPLSGAFPQRNRIVTGLSLGVIVVEASDRSGALISARHASEQGREVFAVPGRVDSRTSKGCHRLLKEGAKLVESVDDVLEELGPLVDTTPQPDGREIRHPAELQLNEQERAVLEAIQLEPTNIDEVVVVSKLGVSRVLSTLSVLEMRRLIRRVTGNRVIRV
jgi:DNA processing protein